MPSGTETFPIVSDANFLDRVSNVIQLKNKLKQKSPTMIFSAALTIAARLSLAPVTQTTIILQYQLTVSVAFRLKYFDFLSSLFVQRLACSVQVPSRPKITMYTSASVPAPEMSLVVTEENIHKKLKQIYFKNGRIEHLRRNTWSQNIGMTMLETLRF